MNVAPGLCASCAHARVIHTRTGSRFYHCQRSHDDPDYPRYPRLPVLRCTGYDPITGGVGPRGAAPEERQ